MIETNKILGLILARGGSKGLPKKNIKNLIDKPLIAWTIEAALNSKYIDDVIVSTDSQEIKDISNKYGALTPFQRPKELAKDESKSSDAILHALNELEKINKVYDYILLLEPTSPLRETDDIDNSIELLNEKKVGSVVSVTMAEGSHPSFVYEIDSNNYLIPYTGEHPSDLRRQDIKDMYFLDGTIYCSTIKDFKKKKTFYHESTIAYCVPKWKSYEVDDIYDFLIIEAIINYKRKNK